MAWQRSGEIRTLEAADHSRSYVRSHMSGIMSIVSEYVVKG